MAALLACLTAACREEVTNALEAESLPPIFPDYTGVTVPVGIAPLNFDCYKKAERMDAVLKGSRTGTLHVQGDYIAFDTERWHKLLEDNRGGTLTCTVCIKEDGVWTRYRDFDIHVSTYPLDDYGLTYRKIAPGYEVYSKMGLYERELASFRERAIMENTRVPGMCVNCHTPNRADPDRFFFHVRGEQGGTLVHKDGKTEILQAVNDSLKGAMVYGYWHPEGRYCAFSTNQTRQGFHMVEDKRIEVFDLSSDVLVYDAEKHELILDTLLMKPGYSENTPVFSPDGRTLYYTTAMQQQYEFSPDGRMLYTPMQQHDTPDFRKQRYSLCRIGFDPETGRTDGHVDTLFNAQTEGKSLTWPRPSYDGKYLMVTVADYGYFSIWHKESDLWMIETETGRAYPLDEANSGEADSYHNWSTGSHWFVFTSRREDGLYSLLYLSCIDDTGKATKPFLLPQKNPKAYYNASVYSYNTPDFTSRPVRLDARAAAEALESGKRVETRVK